MRGNYTKTNTQLKATDPCIEFQLGHEHLLPNLGCSVNSSEISGVQDCLFAGTFLLLRFLCPRTCSFIATLMSQLTDTSSRLGLKLLEFDFLSETNPISPAKTLPVTWRWQTWTSYWTHHCWLPTWSEHVVGLEDEATHRNWNLGKPAQHIGDLV